MSLQSFHCFNSKWTQPNWGCDKTTQPGTPTRAQRCSTSSSNVDPLPVNNSPSAFHEGPLLRVPRSTVKFVWRRGEAASVGRNTGCGLSATKAATQSPVWTRGTVAEFEPGAWGRVRHSGTVSRGDLVVTIWRWSSSNLKVGSSIPSLTHLHAEVSFVKMLNPEWPPIE
ncbi:unnamed protein product [Pleuronectes platessa]|uniref:Uncharacterized protein n=1 Tax=Pleuronectes platessa TaxID=8262 RepID=A0A9N7YIF4_PLEPL|nr:unnamed protein product [Pleuronectes platessa]